MLNRIHEFIQNRGISRYRFWQDTQLGRDTAYRLCNDPTYIPTGGVLDKICSAYKIQPGEFLEWRDDQAQENSTPTFDSSSLRENSQSTSTSKCSSQSDALKLLKGGWLSSKRKAC